MTYLGAAPGRHVQVGPRKESVEPVNNSCSTRQMTTAERAKYGLPNQNGEKVSQLAKVTHLKKRHKPKREITPEELQEALDNTCNVNEAARYLKTGMRQLYDHMKKYGIKANHPVGYNKRDNKEENEVETVSQLKVEPVNVMADQPAPPEPQVTQDEQESGRDIVTTEDRAFADHYISDGPEPADRGYYEVKGTVLGRLVDEKQKAYGDAMTLVTEMLHTQLRHYLNQDGSYTIPHELVDHIARQVRIMDKQCRVFANPKGDSMRESPYRDIAGYGLLGDR